MSRGPSWRRARRRLGALDREVLGAAAATRTPALDRLMTGASTAANRSVLWLGSAALLAITGRRRDRAAAAGGLLGVAIASALANGPLKFLWQRDRPPADAHRRPPLLPLPRTFSFPSGHSASAFAFATGVTRAFPAAGPAVVPMAATVAYSRVYTGVHYPSDVLAGTGIGIASGLGAAALVRHRLDTAHRLDAPTLDVAVPRRAILLTSPKAGSSDDLDAVRAALAAADIEVVDEIEVGAAARLIPLIEVAQHDGEVLVLAAGGDGTVGAAADAVVTGGRGVLGVLPLGTSNDVARSLGLPVDPAHAVAAIGSGRVCAVDAAQATGPDGRSHVFVHAVTLGLNVAFSELATNGSMRDMLGGITYPVAAAMAVRRARPFRATLEYDGGRQDVEVVHLSIGNAPVFGGVLNMRAPGASIVDGELDVLLVGRLSRTGLALAATGTLVGSHRPVRRVESMQVRSVTVHADPAHALAIDGEVIGPSPMEITVLPGALRVVVPAGKRPSRARQRLAARLY